MELKSNKTIEKIVSSKQVPLILSGYILMDKKEVSEYLHLYPKLDHRSYYRMEKSCILEVIETDEKSDGRVSVIVNGDCEIECVSLKKAKDFSNLRKEDCGCGGKNDDGITVEMKKADLRRFVISMAGLLKAMGIDQIDCDKSARQSTVSVACCRAWQQLASDLDTVNETGSAQQVEAMCFGVG